MKAKILVLVTLNFMLFSCGTNPEEIIPTEPVGKSAIVITGTIATTLDYEAEFLHSISTVDTGFTGLTLNMGNIGHTESAVIFRLTEFGNKQGFVPGTYNYTNDPEAQLIFIGYYADKDDIYNINGDAVAINKLVIKTVEETKITGEFELNLEAGNNGDKIKLVGTFEAVGETLKL